MISPHGGKLINRVLEGKEREKLIEKANQIEVMFLNQREISDLEMIATGAMSPLEGFMDSENYESVRDFMRLKNGLVWSIPITLSLKEELSGKNFINKELALKDMNGNLLAIIEVEDQYKVDKKREAEQVLKTSDSAHPGVQYLKSITDIYVGGKVKMLNLPSHGIFEKYWLAPKETRFLFKTKGWNTVVAFQTRNPIHRAHEYLQKCALEIVDALLIHPLMGETKKDDVPAEVRLRCYEVLLKEYYPKTRVAISIFPAAMRYAGPREAIFHAICRKNYGCTHFIVGRDHAGVGNYYGSYDAHYIFREFEPEEIGIIPLFFENAFYCKRCGNMASTKTCPHPDEDHIVLSGTKVREMLSSGELPPLEFTRREVAEILISAVKKG